MKRFKATTRIKEIGPGDDAVEISATILASNALAAATPFRETAAKMAPKEDDPPHAD